jgi:hypothetical protein
MAAVLNDRHGFGFGARFDAPMPVNLFAGIVPIDDGRIDLDGIAPHDGPPILTANRDVTVYDGPLESALPFEMMGGDNWI